MLSKKEEWDHNRSMENANIYTKLYMLVNSRNYLIKLRISEQEVNKIIALIKSKFPKEFDADQKVSNEDDYDIKMENTEGIDITPKPKSQ